jgi:hypothetical protein
MAQEKRNVVSTPSNGCEDGAYDEGGEEEVANVYAEESARKHAESPPKHQSKHQGRAASYSRGEVGEVKCISHVKCRV